MALSVVFIILGGCVKQEGVGEKVISVEELWENRDFYLGKEVIVSGVIKQINPRCTANECYEENPCCQSCGSSLGFKISNGVYLPFFMEEVNGKIIGCTGTNCELNCYPFEIMGNYTVNVIFRQRDEQNYDMKLIGVIKKND